MTDMPQILLFQTTDPVAVKRRLLRFRAAFLKLGPHCRFAAISYMPGAQSGVRRVVLDGIEFEHHVYGPDAMESLGYPLKGAARPFKLIPGNCDLPPLLFRRQQPQYEQYWVVEDDVEYSGEIHSLFAGLERRTGDLLAAHLARGYAAWTYASMLRATDPAVTPASSWLVFLTFYRISGAALDVIDRYYRAGWSAHSENAWATILKHAGMTVVDFGGAGEFVAEADRNKRYHGLANDGFEKSGSFGTMNIRLRAGRQKDMLWHPIKPPKAWLRQTYKRYVSIAKWYLAKLARVIGRSSGPAH
jgi:hypothetical protein